MHGEQNRLTGPDGEVHLSPRCMEVLILLAERAGEVVSREDFNDAIWETEFVTDDALTRHISELRRVLGDDAREPRFIETIPKRGYRLVASVQPLADSAGADGPDRETGSHATASTPPHRKRPVLALVFAMLAIVAIAFAAVLFANRQASELHEPIIAILPFEAFGAETAMPLVDGLHHDLLTRLSNIDELRVISHTSVKRYRDTIQPIPEIAAELGAGWILEGSVQQAGDAIQLNAQLIDADSDSHVWARTYRRELTAENLFAIQAEIVDDIATAMQAQLSPNEQQRVVRVPTVNLEAYTLVIRGATLLGQRTEPAMRQAADLFRQAIDLDPDYADAWAELASAQTLLVYYGHEDLEQTLPRARIYALTAQELEPELPMAHMVLGVVHMHLGHNGPAALEALRKAHALSSDYVGWLAWMQAVAGNLNQALELTREQVRTSPSAPSVNMSMAFLLLGDRQLDAAIDYARKAQDLSPGYALAWLLEGQALLVQGRHQKAIAVIETALDHASDESVTEYRGWLAAAHARAGETERAQELTKSIMDGDDAYALGIARAGMGEIDAALEALGRNGWNDNQSIVLRFHPFLDPLRDDERFRAMIRRLDRHWGLTKG